MITANKASVKTKKSKKGALKAEVIRLVKNDSELVSKIIFSTKKSYPTIMRWINNNSVMLTQAACLNVICSELKLKQSDVLN